MIVSALLLAGGESRRMGQDKAIMHFRGKPFWEHQLGTLRAVLPAALLISARQRPAWCPGDAIFVADAAPSRGPLSGLSAALAVMPSTHLLVLAIDMAMMTPEFLRSLSDQIEPGRGVIPVLASQLEPLAAIYPAEAREDFAQALDGLDFSLRAAAGALLNKDKLRRITVPAEQAGLFANANEPADIASFPADRPAERRFG